MVITLNRKQPENGLRPLIPSRDLQGVASLIEDVFALELDIAGRTALREMKRMGRLGFLLGLFDYLNPDVNSHLNGFVWLENGKIVGNVTVSRNTPGARHWFISNVAVAESHRRRGIARALMIAAVDFVKDMYGQEISLQVRRGNTAAINLYKSFGFRHISATSYLAVSTHNHIPIQPLPAGLIMRDHHLNIHDTTHTYTLARLAVPMNYQAERPLRQSQFRISKTEVQFNNFWRQLVGIPPEKHFIVEQPDQKFAATLDLVTGAWRTNHKLSFMVHPDWWGQLEKPLLSQALSYLRANRVKTILLQHPSEHEAGIAACKSLGFVEQRTHIWMKLNS